MNENKRVFLSTPEMHLRTVTSKTPQFDYNAKSIGKTAHFQVWYATSLGQAGHTIASAVLQRVENDYQTLLTYFAVTPPNFNIIVAPLSSGLDGSGGAYHHACIGSDLYCDAAVHPALDANITNAFVVAEEAEVFMAAQNKGWNCGGSNGEGLSRALAEALYPGVLDGYATAPVWLDGARPDWITQTEGTDQNAESTGCAVLFLNWLHTQLNYSWDKICQAAAPTLAETYTNLTGSSDALQAFTTLIDAHFPPGQPSNVQTDNPFPL